MKGKKESKSADEEKGARRTLRFSRAQAHVRECTRSIFCYSGEQSCLSWPLGRSPSVTRDTTRDGGLSRGSRTLKSGVHRKRGRRGTGGEGEERT